MRVWIDPVRLAARGVTAAEVLAAINNSNFLSAPGKTQNEYVVSSITVRSTLQTPEAFAELPLRSIDGKVVRLRDVARVELGADEHRHQGELQRQARHLPRHLPDAGGQPADHGCGDHQDRAADPGRRCRKA